MEKKIILKGMNELDLQQYCVDLAQPKFHGSQLYRWMYKNNCADIDNMNNIPKILKKEIKNNALLKLLSIKTKSKSSIDNTTKFLLETNDLKYIETVSMIDKDRHTVCLSSQIGCNVDCDFCATGKMGITRNLSTGEIIDQLVIIKENITKPITNIVFMGMGEPFLNYNNLIKSCEILTNHKELYRFPSSILRLNKYPDIDVIAEDAEYRMKVLRFKENDEGVSLAIALLRRYRLHDVSYGMPGSENEEIRSIYQKQSVQTENVYTKDRWHILGQDYRKRAGDKKGEGVYFLLRINSRREIDGNAPSLLMLKEEFL